ncbi:hypothetical protein H072_10922 [Dactylellina haptotyla CBS 200.50]|uniref:Terpene synthase n=1 Tax=Dactylellina haptotyla (strain CBS 200.50) TaxID=1284197 RepID=S8BK67_DACHA|nr:hypothetical protein H072_10922 [Dactylellina haptotyla CBS 200.50]
MPLNLGSHDYVQTLKGQTLIFPNLDELFKSWPTGISPYYKGLRRRYGNELAKIYGKGSKHYEVLMAVDVSLLASIWAPYASVDRLPAFQGQASFLYVFDDELDTPIHSDLLYDLDAGNRFRAKTIAYMKSILGDNPKGSASTAEANSRKSSLPANLELAIQSFGAVAKPIAPFLTKRQRELYLQANISYVNGTGEEQRVELSGCAPNIGEYMGIRAATGGVKSMIAVLEYALEIDLEDEIGYDPDVDTLYEEANIIIFLCNDLFSLRRELAYPFYCNSVAVLYHEHKDLQVAVDETFKMISDSKSMFDATANRLLERYDSHPKLDALEALVNGLKLMSTGNVAWSKQAKRYSLGVEKFDGATSITI